MRYKNNSAQQWFLHLQLLQVGQWLEGVGLDAGDGVAGQVEPTQTQQGDECMLSNGLNMIVIETQTLQILEAGESSVHFLNGPGNVVVIDFSVNK